MISCNVFFEKLKERHIHFFTGVPDSLLKNICACISAHTSHRQHVIAANEGAAIGIAAGYHLATGKIPMVYMQNSGLGNAINPLLSLADKEVYGIPMVLMIGWRGEPDVKDEPQHIKQGRIQKALLSALEIPYRIIDAHVKNIDSTLDELLAIAKNKQTPVALVVRKATFDNFPLSKTEQDAYALTREQAIKLLLQHYKDDTLIVATTGKTSREVFEYRAAMGQSHKQDFLTVGSMGHASQIALGVAMQTSQRVICLDGDGAAIMHMGSMGIVAKNAPSNFLHIVLNNGVHDSVGGQKTIGFDIDFSNIASGCGYKSVFSVASEDEMISKLNALDSADGPIFFEIKVRTGARSDLGRPTNTPQQNKKLFMDFLSRK